jgi:hypothetical protein
MKNTLYNILFYFLNFATFGSFFNYRFISSSVTFPSAGFICKTFSKKSVECVNNQINGAVTIETIFMGNATALAMASG